VNYLDRSPPQTPSPTGVALAAECLRIERFAEAERQLRITSCSCRWATNPVYALGKAKAQFGRDRPAESLATLDDLQKRWPDFQSAEGHLLYARALGAVGRVDEALEEFHAVAAYFPGAEARGALRTGCSIW